MPKSQAFKIGLSAVVAIFAAPQLSYAISGSSISDAITNNVSSIGSTPSTFVQDSAITAYIHTQLVITKNVPSNIDVKTTRGIVMLEGTVASKDQAATVIKIASSVAGVKTVDSSKLKIRA
ncbi:MAG: BON domain-containing protein [Gammaproteobacteria bacterium]